MATYTKEDMFGACPVCNLQLYGRVHNCPGPLSDDVNPIQGAQFMEDLPSPARRSYGDKLDEGFALLVDSGWGENY